MSDEALSEIKSKKSKTRNKPRSLSKIILIVVLLVGASVTIGIAVPALYRPYMAVYLTTGDIYFGKTSIFPFIEIHDPWFLRRAEDGSFGLERISDAIWAPRGGMRINRSQIVFTSKLSELSPVVAAIEGRNAPQQQAQQQQIPQQAFPQQAPQQQPPTDNEEPIDLERTPVERAPAERN